MTKPSRFILNTDYATLKNDATDTLSVTLPSSITLAQGSANRVIRAEKVFGSPSSGWSVIWESTKYAYALCGASIQIACKQDGYDAFVMGNLFREGNKFVLEVTIPSSSWASTTYTQLGQTITAKVQALIDPFLNI